MLLLSPTRVNCVEQNTGPLMTQRLTLLIVLLSSLFLAAADKPYDIGIRNGHIIDGTGSPWYSGDIGIRDGKIAAIGNLTGVPARLIIDAQGMIGAPGFIDILRLSTLTIPINP